MVRTGHATREGVARSEDTVDTWFVILLVGAALISAAGPIVWASAILQSRAAACPCLDARDAAETPSPPPERITRRVDANLAQLDRLLRSVSRRAAGGRTLLGSGALVSPYMQLRIQNMFMETQACLRLLDETGRRRYERRVADLGGVAATAGIRWTSGSD